MGAAVGKNIVLTKFLIGHDGSPGLRIDDATLVNPYIPVGRNLRRERNVRELRIYHRRRQRLLSSAKGAHTGYKGKPYVYQFGCSKAKTERVESEVKTAV